MIPQESILEKLIETIRNLEKRVAELEKLGRSHQFFTSNKDEYLMSYADGCCVEYHPIDGL